MASRNTFRRGGTPLRTVQLSDPFATMVANLNQQLNFLQEQKALAALATGDPDTFLALAKPLLAKKSGQELSVWESLIRKAEEKIEDSGWSTAIESGDATLEDFYEHLLDRLEKSPEGSQESYDILKNLDGAKKAISARDEGISDQKALQEYIETEDHLKYAQYWTIKLARATDPTTFQQIRSKIEELKNRDMAEKQIKRVQERMQVMGDYLNNGQSAGKTIALIQALALDKDISATEVSSLQTLVQQIHDREEDKARRAASGSGGGKSYGVNIPELQANLEFYKTVRGKVDQAIAEGVDPAQLPGSRPNTTLLDDLRAAASVVTGQYRAAAQSAADQNLVDKAEEFSSTAQAFQTHLGSIPKAVDTNVLKNSVKLTADEFKTALGAMTPEGRVQARADRLAALSNVFNRLQTEGARVVVQSDINGLAADEQKDIATLAQQDDLTPADRRDLQGAYKRYQELGGTIPYEQFIGAAQEAGKSGLTGTELSKFFADKVGLKLKPTVDLPFGKYGENDYFTGQTNEDSTASSIVEAVAGLAKGSTLLDNQATAERMAKKWLSIPGAMPFGDPGTPEYALLGLTATDIVEMRRGAGLIGPKQAGFSSGSTSSASNEEDLMAYPSSDQELRQERAMARREEEKMRTEVAVSIEDTLLATTPPPPPPFFDPMGANLDPGMVEEPNRYDGMSDTWANALRYLDSPVVLDVPGFQIPNTPEQSPFASLPKFDDSIAEYNPANWDIPVRDAHDYMDSRRGTFGTEGSTADMTWDRERGIGAYDPDTLEANSTPPIGSGRPQ